MAQQLGSNYYNSPFKFNGKELDEETGFYYYGARYYDPKISIWLSTDPLAEKFPNFNPYNYVMQNPLNLIDPTGMAPEEGGATDPPKGGGPIVSLGTGKEVVVYGKANYSKSDYTYRSWLKENNEYYFNIIKSQEDRGIYNRLQTVKKDYWKGFGGQFDQGGATGSKYDCFGMLINYTLMNVASEAIIGSYAIDAYVVGNGALAAKGGFNFTKTAAAHMDEAGRMILVQILDDIIKAPMQVLKDPQGTNALMHYSQMWKNSKLYNVEVLYDKVANTIMHFKYTQKAIGPLQAIPK